jgi:hypothetical protein
VNVKNTWGVTKHDNRGGRKQGNGEPGIGIKYGTWNVKVINTHTFAQLIFLAILTSDIFVEIYNFIWINVNYHET